MKQNLALSVSIIEIVPLLNLCLTEDHLNEIIKTNQENIPLLHTSLKVKYYYVLQGQQQKLRFPLYNIFKKVAKNNLDDICKIIELSVIVQNSDDVTLSIIQYLEELQIDLKDVDIILKLLYTIINIYYVCKLDLPHCLNEKLIYSLYMEIYNSGCKSLQNQFCRLLIKYVSCANKVNSVLHSILSFNDLYTVSCCSHIFTQHLSVIESDRFWLIITSNIKSSDYHRKLSLHILKQYIHYTKEHNQLGIIKGDTQSGTEFMKCWNDYFTLMDLSQEKSLHLIVPALALIPNIVTLHSSWVICLYKVLLSHTQNAVVFFVANTILDTNIISSSEIFESVIQCLLPALNKYEYSDDFFKIFKKLRELAKTLESEQFPILLKESLNVVWSPVPAWYFYSSVLVDKCRCEIDHVIMISIFNKIKHLSHPFIRDNCQILLLQFLIKQNLFINLNIDEFINLGIDLKKCNSKLLSLFYQYAERNMQIYNRNDDVLRKINSISRYSTKEEVEVILQIADYNTKNISAVRNILSPEILAHQISDYLILYLCKHDSNKSNVFDYLERKLLTRHCSTNSYVLCNVSKYVKLENASASLLAQCKVILSNPDMFKEDNIVLAFEIYNKNIDIYLDSLMKLWNNKLLKGDKIESRTYRCYFKMYLEYLRNNRIPFSSLQEIYENMLRAFDAHGEDIWVDVYDSLDIIVNLNNDELIISFLGKLLQELCNIKCSENFVKAWSAFIKAILNTNIVLKDDIKGSVLPKIFEITLANETNSYIFVNKILNASSNIALSFIDLLVHLTLHGGVIKKHKRCEFYACKEIDRVLNVQNKNNPNYIHTNIRSVAANAIFLILNGNGQDTANLIVEQCIEKYRQHFKKRYFPDSEIHLSKLRIIQLLLILKPHVEDEWKTSIVDLIIESFCEESHQPCVKQLMQWLLILLLLDDHKYVQKIFHKMDTASRTHTSTITAFVPVLCHVGFNSNEEFIENLIQFMLEWTMGAHFKLRVYSQVGICKLIEISIQKKYTRVIHKYDAFYKSIKKLLEMAGPNIDNVLQTDKTFLNEFDVKRHYNLHSIYISIPCLNNVPETEWDYIDVELFYHCKTIHSTGHTIDTTSTIKKAGVASNSIAVDYSVNNIQKKILPAINPSVVDENEEKHYHTALILVATLVDSAANLGGIARTCEIYGVKQLVVSDRKVLNDKEFKSLSVSSEHWLDVSEVKFDALEDYLQRMKDEGYTVVGLEQTADSTKLHNYSFPKKCMLVLGNEKEGMPSRIFPFLDVCVEIPQFGLLRSLNVHVAGAITIWEYAKQNTLL